MSFRSDLFIGAQAVPGQDEQTMWEQACRELREGHKRTHWIWFIFPQHVDLGRSLQAKLWGLTAESASAYLTHPVLGVRLWRATRLANWALQESGFTFSEVDSLKLRSSMTLFSWSAQRVRPNSDWSLFQQVIDAHYSGEPCPRTMEILKRSKENANA